MQPWSRSLLYRCEKKRPRKSTRHFFPGADTTPGHQHWGEIARPQPGDLILFDWPDNNKSQFDHTTIFVGPAGEMLDYSDRTIYATSSDGNWKVWETHVSKLEGQDVLPLLAIVASQSFV
jgi:hypothetical protein